MKGIVLAGGSGTRLFPITKGVSKQLLPIYDKPMIYYPISVLMLAGIREILIISTPDDMAGYQRLLGDGSQFGVRFTYEIQPSPDGLAQAFLIGESFIGDDDVCLILGDNIYFGESFSQKLERATDTTCSATVFGYQVTDPERFGVVEFDDDFNAVSIEEKPKIPKSNYAVTGLKVELLGRGFAWLDTGTHESLMDASNFVYTIEKRQGLKVACLEEIAYRKGWVTKADLQELVKPLAKTGYGQYIQKLIETG